MPQQKKRSRRKKKGTTGRRDSDLWIRLRALLWYHHVHRAEPATDTKLDEDYVLTDREGHARGVERPRTFENIGKFAVDPDWQGSGDSRRDFSLIDRLAKHKRFKHATEIGKTELWRLLKPVAPTRTDVDEIISVVLKSRGLFRAPGFPPEQWPIQLLENDAFSVFPSKTYLDSINAIADDASPNSIALLGALYLEAMNETELEQAVLLQRLIREATQTYIRKFDIRGLPRVLLIGLIEERLIRRRWEIIITRTEKRSLLEARKPHPLYVTGPERKITSFEHAADRFLLGLRAKGRHLFSITPMTDDLRVLSQHPGMYTELHNEAKTDKWSIPALDQKGKSFYLEAYAALDEFFVTLRGSRARRIRKSKRNPDDILKR